MSITKTICIIDSDACFAALLISRIQKQLPGYLAFRLSKETLLNRSELLLDNDYLLFNQHEISEEELKKHCHPTKTPTMIPLLGTEKPYPPKDVLMLVHEIESHIGLGMIPLPIDTTVQTALILSFVSPEERELHVQKQITRSMSEFAHVVRLDIMPGILMPPDPEFKDAPVYQKVSGISELLSRLSKRGFSFKDIPSYLEPDPYGDLRFGKPVHSDDIITAHTKTHLFLIQKTVSYLKSLGESSLLIVVADGLSFRRIRSLSRNLSHLEVLTPLHVEKDYMLCNEIDTIVKAHNGTSHIDFPYRIDQAEERMHA